MASQIQFCSTANPDNPEDNGEEREEAEDSDQQRRRTAEDRPYIEQWRKEKKLGDSRVKVIVSGDKIPKRLPTRKEVKNSVKSVQLEKNPSMEVANASASASASQLVRMIDTIDRPGNAYAKDVYAEATTFVTGGGINKPGERIPKAGAYAEAGVGKAGAEFSVFEAEAKGPNAYAGAEANVVGVSAIARAEVGSVSVGAGPFTAKLGLGVDTGVSAGVDGIELKVLGTGVRIGPKTSISLLGSEVECVIQ